MNPERAAHFRLLKQRTGLPSITEVAKTSLEQLLESEFFLQQPNSEIGSLNPQRTTDDVMVSAASTPRASNGNEFQGGKGMHYDSSGCFGCCATHLVSNTEEHERSLRSEIVQRRSDEVTRLATRFGTDMMRLARNVHVLLKETQSRLVSSNTELRRVKEDAQLSKQEEEIREHNRDVDLIVSLEAMSLERHAHEAAIKASENRRESETSWLENKYKAELLHLSSVLGRLQQMDTERSASECKLRDQLVASMEGETCRPVDDIIPAAITPAAITTTVKDELVVVPLELPSAKILVASSTTLDDPELDERVKFALSFVPSTIVAEPKNVVAPSPITTVDAIKEDTYERIKRVGTFKKKPLQVLLPRKTGGKDTSEARRPEIAKSRSLPIVTNVPGSSASTPDRPSGKLQEKPTSDSATIVEICKVAPKETTRNMRTVFGDATPLAPLPQQNDLSENPAGDLDANGSTVERSVSVEHTLHLQARNLCMFHGRVVVTQHPRHGDVLASLNGGPWITMYIVIEGSACLIADSQLPMVPRKRLFELSWIGHVRPFTCRHKTNTVALSVEYRESPSAPSRFLELAFVTKSERLQWLHCFKLDHSSTQSAIDSARLNTFLCYSDREHFRRGAQFLRENSEKTD